MAYSLYDTTVPLLIRGLKNTHALLQKAETWCKENNKPESEILHARLSPDMNDFVFQVRVASITARNTALTADWAWIPSATALADESSLAGLRACLQKDIAWLEGLTKADVDGQEKRAFRFWTSGQEGVGFEFKFTDGVKYIQQIGIPNFYFHNSMAYGLCRMKGVPLGKFDFLAGGAELDY
ncbi:uncharacterized protein LTHEOB_100 [Lasiodiplodia theobromae]|uniref:uncharacterized protein n=1 Tax=Lasiodiplodia theobromae TaxID=45133 RepID=UPI0015C3527A|nr:uncharacterized protein LTHEOB_100 [Lasiodiplodia theobromae]KAF4543401.1 hypothetical protein LTHEOB_100 [Lasiodiplodia theobromae]